MFKLKNLPLTASLVVVISLIVGWGISMVLAWADPPGGIPPSGNVAAPINVSGTGQTKTGDLNIGGGLSYWITKNGDSFALKNNAGTINLMIGQDGAFSLKELSSSPGATANYGNLYVKTDGNFYFKNDSGTEFNLSGAVAGTTLWAASGNNISNTNTGNVGIGTTAPDSRLHILGMASTTIPALRVASSGTLANNDILRVQINGLTNGFRMFQDASSNVIYSFQNGNVGIGTTTPGYPLTIAGVNGPNMVIGSYTDVARMYSGADSIFGHNVYADSSSRVLKQLNTGYYGAWIRMYYNGGIYFGTSTAAGTAGDTVSDPAGTTNERMVITNAGNVGIGTANPTYKLQVVGSTYLSGIPTIGDGGTSLYGWGLGDGVWPPPVNGQIPYVFNNHTGLAFSAHSAYGGIRFYNQAYPDVTQSTLVMDIINGNVGIGTTAPSQKLDVGGNINAQTIGATQYCINPSGGCITSWPAGGGGANNYPTGISFSGNATKTLTLTRNGLPDLTATFTDNSGAGVADGNNYPTAIAFSGNAIKTLTLTRNGLPDLTATFTDNSGAGGSDTLDTVCDRGCTTDQTINTSGEVKAGNGAATMQSNGALVSTYYVKGTKFFDSDDTNYYVNPAGSSKIIDLETAGVIKSWGGFWTDTSVNAVGSIRAGTDVNAGTNVLAANNISAQNDVIAGASLRVGNLIYAPNQGWSDTKVANKYTTPSTAVFYCDDGWFLYWVQISNDGVSSNGKCASPFKKNPVSPPPGPKPPDAGCFAGDTKILMADGKYKEIKDVGAGDYILTKKAPDSDELVKARVYKSMNYDGWDGYLIINKKLKVTTNHMIYVNGEWKEAGKIKIEDGLLGEGGKKEIVKSIEKVDQPITVYNIEVDEYASYFANGIYVHNNIKPQ